MNNFIPYLKLLKQALETTDSWRNSYGNHDSGAQYPSHLDPENISETIQLLATKLKGNYPFHHPQYAGQMLKPPHPVAWISYALAMTINPNNHALDGGPPTSIMEKEAVKMLADMVGYSNQYLGHLTSGGTIANLEALYVAREIHPQKAIAATANAHYTHRRMCRVLNCDFIEIPVNHHGEPDLDFIQSNCNKIGTVVVTMGTTGLGHIEPLTKILEISQKVGFRVHADAAYGGFFKIISDTLPSAQEWDQLHLCDSIVIDPHKHGLQPYGCGSILYKDAAVGTFFNHDSPYTYFTSDDLHLGEISLECSRAGASAAAFWSTLQMLPLTKNGLGSLLSKTRDSAIRFSKHIQNHPNWALYSSPELDITGYFKTPRTPSLNALNKLNKEIFEKGMKDKENGFHLSLFKIPAQDFIQTFPQYQADAPHAIILRSVFMKEEHASFVDELADRLFKN